MEKIEKHWTRPYSIQHSTASHDYGVAIGNSRVGYWDVCLFPYTVPLSFSSISFNGNDLTFFKRYVFNFLKNS